MVKDGVTSYATIGYALDDGRIIAPKLIEYLVIENAYASAHNEKAQRK